jgi:hypothetical protein
MMRVCETIVALEKQQVLHIFVRVCVVVCVWERERERVSEWASEWEGELTRDWVRVC